MGLYTTKTLQLSAPADKQIGQKFEIREAVLKNASMGEERGAYRVLVGKPEGKRPLGRPRR